MKKFFVCLANSYMYNERFIAGIELTNTNGNFSIVRKDKNNMKWLRPVTDNTGQVPIILVNEVQLLDIYEIEIIGKCPKGYQVDNISFKPNSLKKISSFPSDHQTLSNFVESHEYILNNQYNTLSIMDIYNVNTSLQFIKATDVKIYKVHNSDYLAKFHINFNYRNQDYNLLITDIQFIQKNINEFKNSKTFRSLFLTVSIGFPNNKIYPKCVTGIFQI